MTFWQLGKVVVIKLIFYGLALLLTLVTGLSVLTTRLVAATETPPMAQADNVTAPAREVTQVAGTVVDMTQDVKAMGYPDGRKIVRDRAGHLYVAYRKKYKQAELTAYHIFVAKSLDNGVTWQVLNRGQPIETVGDYNQRVPAIAIDNKQFIHVVWYGKDAQHNGSEENQIKYVRSSDGGASWSTWQNIAPISGYSGESLWQEHPTLYIDRNDTLYIAWEGRDSYYADNSQVKLIKSVDGGYRWSTWLNVAPSQHNFSRPALVATVQGDLYLLAYGRAGARQQILYTYSSDGGNRWQPWSRLAPSRQDQRHLSVDTDRQGELHVVWRQTPDQLFGQRDARIHYAHFDGHRWSVPLQVAPTVVGAQTFPSIGIDQQDSLWITWSTTTRPYAFPNDAPETGVISYIVKTKAGWSEPFTLASAGRDIYASLERRNGVGDGPLGLIWLANNGEDKQIRFATLTLPTHFTTAPPLARAGLFGVTSLNVSALGFTSLRQLFAGSDWLPLLWQRQLAREMESLLLVIFIVTVYVIAKFLVARRRQLPLS